MMDAVKCRSNRSVSPSTERGPSRLYQQRRHCDYPHRRNIVEKQIRELRAELLEEHFDGANRQRVVEWLVASEGRRPVVLVGAGFSRNARHRLRNDHARPSETPLWADVNSRLAGDLGVPATNYDPLTLAEMYCESFGEPALRDTLTNIFPNEELEPGIAHASLAQYDTEAIITTNLFDTLLDDGNHACYSGRPTNLVIRDIDLSSRQRSQTESQDLIYLHGHRSQFDTWVFTRSQYEDAPKTRPVILTRVRQLFAQHPLLVIGFGLGDPHFHHVYRQLAGEMRRHQPLALAVQMHDVSPAELRHWESLGVRVATPSDSREIARDPERCNRFFKWLFERIPTTWSPDDSAVLQYATRPAQLESRFDRLDKLLPLRAALPGRTLQQEQAAEFRAWSAVLTSSLSEQERTDCQRHAEEAVAWARRSPRRDEHAATGEQAPSPTLPPRTRHLPRWPSLRPTRAFTWQLDKIVQKTEKHIVPLAKFFELGLQRGLFMTDAAEAVGVPWIPLSFWLACRASDDKHVLSSTLRICVDEAAKYGDTEWTELLREEARGQTLDMPEPSPTADVDGARDAAEGQRALLAADPRLALAAYTRASIKARASQLAFEEWVWCTGELESVLMIRAESDLEDSKSEAELVALTSKTEQLERRCETLASSSTVRSWLQLSERRVREHLERAFDEAESDLQARLRGAVGVRLNDSDHSLWRSYKDLDRIGAPPQLVLQYLTPLLRGSPLPEHEELQLRVRFGVDKTSAWVHRYILSSSIDTHAHKRDALLCETLFSVEEPLNTDTAQLTKLDALPVLASALETSAVPAAFAWLKQVRTRFKGPTAASFRFLSSEFSDALGALSTAGDAVSTLAIFREWWDENRSNERNDLCRAASRFPWRRWAIGELGPVLEWIRWATHASQRNDWTSLAYVVSEAMLQIARFAPGQVPVELLNEIRASTAQQSQSNSTGEAASCFSIDITVNELDSRRSNIDILKTWMPTNAKGDSSNHAVRWTMLARVADLALANGDAVDAELLLALQSEWDWASAPKNRERVTGQQVRTPAARNLGLARFLGACMRLLPQARASARDWLLTVFEHGAGSLEAFSALASKELWGESWSRVVEILVAAVHGIGGTRLTDGVTRLDSGLATRQQRGALDCWSALLRPSPIARRINPDRAEVIVKLCPTVRQLVRDERALLANQATFSVGYAMEEIADINERHLLAQAVEQASRDGRTVVRMAAAYVAGRFAGQAGDPVVAATLLAVSQRLSQDPNARVAVQLKRGIAEGSIAHSSENSRGGSSSSGNE